MRVGGHAVAVALFGWYLMIPPTPGEKVDENAPLSRWKIVISNDLAKECTDALVHGRAKYQGGTMGEAFARGACISTDDPRLAK